MDIDESVHLSQKCGNLCCWGDVLLRLCSVQAAFSTTCFSFFVGQPAPILVPKDRHIRATEQLRCFRKRIVTMSELEKMEVKEG